MGEVEWVHAVIGAIASVIFLFQTLGSAEHDIDATDMDMGLGGDHAMGLSGYLSVRNFVAFFIGYGWVTLAGLLSGATLLLSSLLGLAAGIIFIVASLFLIRTFLKFQEDGSLRLEELIGEGGSVYIAIGESGSSQGKILVDTRNKGRMELPARTKDMGKLLPGKWVEIVGADKGVLWVSEKKPEK